MPLATFHLIALSPTTAIATYVQTLRSNPSLNPYVVSRVLRWIIVPQKLSATRLLTQKWDLLIILPASQPLLDSLLDPRLVTNHWTITAGIPKSLTTDFASHNASLLNPSSPLPPLTNSLPSTSSPLSSSLLSLPPSSQNLELSPQLLHWIRNVPFPRQGAVSMLNLLSFHPSPSSSSSSAAHESYLRYGKAFAETIGKKRGGEAKLVGRVVVDREGGATRDEDRYGWDEVALAHYPTLTHFADMLAGEDYQKVNRESRLPALRDTCILCTSEVDAEVLEGMGEGAKARL